MRLTIERDALASLIASVQPAAAKRGTIPILANVLLTADGDTLTAHATDLTMEASARVPCEVAKAGAITVSAQSLSDIAKSLTDGAQARLELDDRRLSVVSGRARWKLATLPAGDFPTLRGGEWTWEATLRGADFREVLRRTAWAISRDEGKRGASGLRVFHDGERLTCVATNWKEVMSASFGVGAAPWDGVTIPTATVAAMASLAADQPDVRLMASETLVSLVAGTASITSKVVADKFPDYDRLRTWPRTADIVLDGGALTAALRRTLVALDTGITGHGVTLDAGVGVLGLSMRGALNEAADEIEIEFDGEPTRIAINGAAMLDVMGAMGAGRVRLSFAPGDVVPLLVTADGDDGAWCVTAQQMVA